VLKNNVFATVLAARTRVRGMVWKKFARPWAGVAKGRAAGGRPRVRLASGLARAQWKGQRAAV